MCASSSYFFFFIFLLNVSRNRMLHGCMCLSFSFPLAHTRNMFSIFCRREQHEQHENQLRGASRSRRGVRGRPRVRADSSARQRDAKAGCVAPSADSLTRSRRSCGWPASMPTQVVITWPRCNTTTSEATTHTCSSACSASAKTIWPPRARAFHVRQSHTNDA